MSLATSWSLARQSLKAHRLRTTLTVLGVVVGGFILTLVLLISGGLRQGLTDQANDLGAPLIVARSAGDQATGLEAFSPLKLAAAPNLTDQDARAVAGLSAAERVAPMLALGGSVKAGSQTYRDITTVATNSELPQVLNLPLADGAWWSDTEASRNYVVLGAKLAEGLLGSDKANGQTVLIKNQQFVVVGVLKLTDQPISLAGVDVDKTAFISLTNGQKFAGDGNLLSQILVRVRSGTNLATAQTQIQQTLQQRHADAGEFAVATGAAAARELSGWVETLGLAALIFAGIALLVGGIGIMNIMLVAVVERRREIGVRKAVGATRRQIMEQFLVETLAMCLSGAVVGVVLAYGVGWLITLQFSLPLVYDWWIFALGLGVPLGIGLIFGLYPAWLAARQEPIESLRAGS